MNKDKERLDVSDGVDTIVSRQVKVEGDLISEGNVQIDGEIKGTISTRQNLGIGESAKIEADIKAKNAMVAGEIKGNLDITESLELTETAKIYGNIKTKVLAVAAGAILQGNCQMAGSANGSNKPSANQSQAEK